MEMTNLEERVLSDENRIMNFILKLFSDGKPKPWREIQEKGKGIGTASLRKYLDWLEKEGVILRHKEKVFPPNAVYEFSKDGYSQWLIELGARLVRVVHNRTKIAEHLRRGEGDSRYWRDMVDMLTNSILRDMLISRKSETPLSHDPIRLHVISLGIMQQSLLLVDILAKVPDMDKYYESKLKLLELNTQKPRAE